MQEIRPAATVMLLRQGKEGLEVLLLKRNKKLKFAPAFWVFPGGKIDQEDIIAGANPVEAAKIAAVREAEEEAGVSVTIEKIHYFCHWTTPPMQKRRFATSFFVSLLPTDQAATIQIDDGEIKDYCWLNLQEAIQKSKTREIPMLPPTYLAIQRFSKCQNEKDILAETTTVQPKVLPTVSIEQSEPPILHYIYEGDAAYKNAKHDTPGPRHRLVGGLDGGYQFHYKDCEMPAVNGGHHL